MRRTENKTTDLLDIRDLRLETLSDLRDDFLDELLVLHRLSCLHDTVQTIESKAQQCMIPIELNVPDDRCLQGVFTIFVDGLEDIRRFRLLLGLQRGVEVDTDLLRLEV